MKCKNCKYWKRPWTQDLACGRLIDVEADNGRCEKITDIKYYDNLETVEISTPESEDTISGDNVYTGENFGCIHFYDKCNIKPQTTLPQQ